MTSGADRPKTVSPSNGRSGPNDSGSRYQFVGVLVPGAALDVVQPAAPRMEADHPTEMRGQTVRRGNGSDPRVLHAREGRWVWAVKANPQASRLFSTKAAINHSTTPVARKTSKPWIGVGPLVLTTSSIPGTLTVGAMN